MRWVGWGYVIVLRPQFTPSCLSPRLRFGGEVGGVGVCNSFTSPVHPLLSLSPRLRFGGEVGGVGVCNSFTSPVHPLLSLPQTEVWG